MGAQDALPPPSMGPKGFDSPPGWPLWAEQTSSAGLEMPNPRTHVSIIKSCHVYCSSSTDWISSQGGPWDDGTQWANGWHQCSKMPSSKKESHHQNPVLSQIALAQFSEVSLILGTSSKPVDKASPTVFYASSKSPSLWYLLCPFPGTHKWSQQSPNVGLPTNCPVPWACFSAQVHLSIELLMKGYFDPPKATVERKQKSTDINPGQEPGLWVQGSILWRLKVLQLAEEKEQNHQPEWPPTFRLFFSYQLLL